MCAKMAQYQSEMKHKMPFHTLAYNVIYNLFDISVSYFIKISSYRERFDLNSKRTQKFTFHLDFRSERVENKGK